MITISVDGFKRDCVYGVRTDYRFNIFYIAVFRVLGACAGPEQSLYTSAIISQFLKPVTAKNFLIDLVSRLSARSSHLSMHLLRNSRLLAAWLDEFLHQRVH